ncbi:MAG: HPr family phosphocarrier protein [Gammaproteobacteria bacterium]|nr:HPr family phosphocarrier protein [Gammaproteobacteria bacterium]
MRRAEVTLVNRLGLHARAAAKLVSVARTFASRITLEKDGAAVDGKSIMNILLLAAPVGSVLELTVEGEDEAEAFAAIEALIADRFGEDE